MFLDADARCDQSDGAKSRHKRATRCEASLRSAIGSRRASSPRACLPRGCSRDAARRLPTFVDRRGPGHIRRGQQRPVRERFSQVRCLDVTSVIEIGNRARDAQDAVIAPCR